jgi:hypothetical protein
VTTTPAGRTRLANSGRSVVPLTAEADVLLADVARRYRLLRDVVRVGLRDAWNALLRRETW